MANPRALDKRRKSIRNIRKITRTMELIATARFKKAMDRAHAATAYTKRITALVADLAQTGLEVSHPLLESREHASRGVLLVLSANRGFCGGFNTNVVRAALARWRELEAQIPNMRLEVSGKRGISGLTSRGAKPDATYTQFEDRPAFAQVETIASGYLDAFVTGQIDRLDVAYTRFDSASKQTATIETLLPLSAADVGPAAGAAGEGGSQSHAQYEFVPSPESILEEVVPTSFKVRLFKCFLDTAVSEQIARMIAMKSATENAGELIRDLSMQYNRARQGQITSELMDLLGGVEALK